MNELELLDAMGTADLSFRLRALDQPVRKHRGIRGFAAAACFLLIAGAVFGRIYKNSRKQEYTVTEHSIASEVTEVAEVNGTEDRSLYAATTATFTGSAVHSTFSSAAYTAIDSTNTQLPTEGTAKTTTNDDAWISTYPQIPAISETETTSTVTAAATPQTENRITQPYGLCKLPDSLVQTLKNTIKTSQFCYYMDTPLPYNSPWQKTEIPILTKDRTYLMIYLWTDTTCDTNLYTYIEQRTFTVTAGRSLETELSGIAAKYGGDLKGGYSEKIQKYEYFLSDSSVARTGSANETERQQKKSEWAWLVAAELHALPDASVQLGTVYPYSQNSMIHLNYSPDEAVLSPPIYMRGTLPLTKSDVIRLAKKGFDLTWEDFYCYICTEIGSGRLILEYDVEGEYTLVIAGSPNKQPEEMLLCKNNQHPRNMDSPGIDIRKDDAEAFFRGQ